MLFGLIALAIMMIGAVAMIRSMNTAQFNAGNLGFKRDLTNQAERGMAEALDRMTSGGLSTEASRQTSSAALNYSATMLPSNTQGLPNVLITDTTTPADITVAEQGVTIRYLIDRLCTADGVPSAANCSMSDDLLPMGSSSSEADRAEDPPGAASAAGGVGPAVSRRVVYRVSVRVSGPRNTQAYFQTTLTPP